MANEPIECKGLSSVALYLCRSENGEISEDVVEETWSCVKDEFIKAHGTEDELFRLANVGYVAEPQGHRIFVNNPSKLEIQEKLNFAYHDPKYYKCIAKSNLPLQFAMNDFKASTPFDDKTRIRFQNEVDSLKKGLAKDADKFPPDSAAYRRELTRRIFEEHTKKEKFYGDCEIECDDHEAIKFRRGICTETSAVVYFKCKYAGLNPSFFYLHDIEPSLQWIDLLPKLGEAADHVFIGVPLSGGAASEEFLYVDPVREMYDVKYKYAKEISERVFASISTRNKVSDIARHHRLRDAEETLKHAIILTPEDIQPYLKLNEIYLALDQAENFKYVSGYIKRHFEHHPWGRIVAFHGENSNLDIEKIGKEGVAARMKEGERIFEEMGKKDPYMAAQFYYYLARPRLMAFVSMAQAAVKNGGQVDQNFRKQMIATANVSLEMYFKSLMNDPNFIFAYRDLAAFFDSTGEYQLAVEVWSKLVEAHPQHAPFVYSLATSLSYASRIVGIDPDSKQKLLEKAREQFDRLAELEPENPSAYVELGKFLTNCGDVRGTLEKIDKADELILRKFMPIPLENYMIRIASNILLGNVEESMSVTAEALKKYPKEGPEYIAGSLYRFLNWDLTLGQKDYIRDDGITFDKPQISYVESLYRVSANLMKYKEARQHVRMFRAYFAPFVLLYFGPEKIGDWFKDFSSNPSDNVVQQLARSTARFAEMLQTSNAHIEKENYDGMLKYIDIAEPILKKKFGKVIHDSRVGLLWGYVLLQDRQKAESVLDKIDANFIVEAIGFSVLKLVRQGKGTKTNTERLCLAMDLMWENRKRLNPGQKSQLVELYFQLASMCRNNGMDAEAVTAEARAEELRK